MAPSKRKRASTVANGSSAVVPVDPKTELRNMWEFAALWQYCSIFSEALALPDILIEDLEEELLHPDRKNIVPKVQLALLKHNSSKKGLQLEQFDEIVKGLYEDSGSESPYGDSGLSFVDCDVPTKVRIMHQLSVWSFRDPERLRHETSEHTYQQWRIDPCGFDAKGNTYYMLDDNRLYKLTAAPEPVVVAPKQPKTNKKRRITVEAKDLSAKVPGNEVGEWSCVCVSFEEWTNFADGFRRSKNPDEAAFYEHLKESVLPILEKEEEARQKKILEHKKKLELEALVANRKRSSRIDAKLARQKEEEELAEKRRQEEEKVRQEKLERKKKEKMHQEREKRLLLRDERMRKRQEAQASRPPAPPAPEPERKSTRARANGTASKKSGDKWDFDCVCGVHGTNYDDGSLIIACDKCEVWQHLACIGIPKEKAEEDFVCDRCIRLEKEAKERAEEEKRQAILRQKEEEERKVREKREEEERQIRLQKEAEERRLRMLREEQERRLREQQQQEALRAYQKQQELSQQLPGYQYPPTMAYQQQQKDQQRISLASLLSQPASIPRPQIQVPMGYAGYAPPPVAPAWQAPPPPAHQSAVTPPQISTRYIPYIPTPSAGEVKPGPLSPSRDVVVNGFAHNDITRRDVNPASGPISPTQQSFAVPRPDSG